MKTTLPEHLRKIIDQIEQMESELYHSDLSAGGTAVALNPHTTQTKVNPNQRVRLLVIEDDTSIVRLIRSYVAMLECQYVFGYARTAEAGLSLWQREPYDILLVDYHLPGMSGIELIKKLKNLSEGVPIILFTAYDSPEIRREARRIGVSRYLAKPFLLDDMLDAIRHLLHLS